MMICLSSNYSLYFTIRCTTAVAPCACCFFGMEFVITGDRWGAKGKCMQGKNRRFIGVSLSLERGHGFRVEKG